MTNDRNNRAALLRVAATALGAALGLAVLIAATQVTPGKRIKDYPHTNQIPDWALFILEDTNRPPGSITPATNLNQTALELFQQATNPLASIVALLATSNSLASASFAKLEVQTNGTRVGLTTNLNFNAGVTGYVSGSTIVLGVRAGVTGSTNFINLSVQAAKLPATNYPGIDGGNQDWEVLYYHTNAENAVANLNASWQFVVPPDYATNSGKLHVQHTLIATNGPNSSNVVWTVDCVRSHSGDGVNLHAASFGVQVHGTNTWAQSSTIVNAQSDLIINLDTNLLWQAGDLVLLRLTRNTANDTYRNTAVGLVGLQLEYTKQ